MTAQRKLRICEISVSARFYICFRFGGVGFDYYEFSSAATVTHFRSQTDVSAYLRNNILVC